MLDKKVIELLNDQINKEFYSAYLYLDIANYYTANDLDGFANWYTIQAGEERDHAMLFLKYLQINGIPVELKAIDKPDKTFETHLDPLVAGAEHERFVTSLIHNIYDAAYGVKDFRTMQFLDWLLRSRWKRKKTPIKWLININSLAMTPKAFICWIKNSPQGFTQPQALFFNWNFSADTSNNI